MSILNNKPTQAFQSLFNPVLLRAYQQKQTFAPVHLKPFTYDSWNFNPYLCFLSMEHKNIHELQSLFTSVASTFKGSIKCSSDLAGIYKNLSGISTLVHGYAAFALPTWHASPAVNTTATKPSRLETEDFAQLIAFKQRDDTSQYRPQANKRPVCETTPDHPVIIQTDSVLIDDAKFPDDALNRNPTDYFLMKYSDEFDLYPDVRVLNFAEEDTISAWLTTLCGMIIESDELEASTVLQPNVLVELGIENAQFLGSAIPLRHVRPATHYKVITTRPSTYSDRFPVAIRDTVTASSPPAATLFRSTSRVILPFVVTNNRYLGLSRLNYGLHHEHNTTFSQIYQTFFGFKVNAHTNRAHNPAINEPPNTPYARLQVWSPYIYMSPSFDEEWDDDSIESEMKKIFFITNLRTFFGTDPSLIEIAHPLSAMPIS